MAIIFLLQRLRLMLLASPLKNIAPVAIGASLHPNSAAPVMVSLSASSTAAATAAKILSAEAAGCLTIYFIGMCVGRLHTETLILPTQDSFGHLTTAGSSNDNIQRFWAAIHGKNLARIVPRFINKMLGVLFLLLMGSGKILTSSFGNLNEAMPSWPEMILCTVWHGMLGFADELDDLPVVLQDETSYFFSKLARVAILLPIPILMMATPSLYIPYAMIKLMADGLSHKIDTTSFQQVAVFGIGMVGILTKVLHLKLQNFPLLGLSIVVLANALYEAHDEHPLLVKLNEQFPIMNKVWDYASSHTVMVMLVFMGILPPAWLSVQSTSYALSKLSLARGALSSMNTL